MASTTHVPVLVPEVLSQLVLLPNGNYLDATFGGGGHTRAILEKLDKTARVLALDRDPEAFERAKFLAEKDPRVVAAQASFDRIVETSQRLDFDHFDGVLFDLGISSDQLESERRGFSFLKNGPLDMRMDPTSGTSAAEWLNSASTRAIALVLKKYGDERNAKSIALAIEHNRPFTDTHQLVAVIARACRTRDFNKHVATRTFQAIRIQVNDELTQLRHGLRNAFELVSRRGRIGVISFHSLEHRTVRKQFSHWVESQIPARVPVRGSNVAPMKIVQKGLVPKRQEIEHNPRARSALFQVIERVR